MTCVSVTWGSGLIVGPVNRVVATMQNGVEVLRFGGLQTGSRPSPFQTVERCDMYRLRRYFPEGANDPSRPPVVLVPPMMMSANVFDVTRDQGAVGVRMTSVWTRGWLTSAHRTGKPMGSNAP